MSALGETACEHHDYIGSVTFFARVLEKHPYAEEALLGMVRAALRVRRHGEALRHYHAYARRMAELAIEPSPMPDLDSEEEA